MAGENNTNPLWMRSVATVYDGRVGDFKDLVQETSRTIRGRDSRTCIFSAFLDEANRAAVEVYGDPISETRDALRGVGSPATYYPSPSAL